MRLVPYNLLGFSGTGSGCRGLATRACRGSRPAQCNRQAARRASATDVASMPTPGTQLVRVWNGRVCRAAVTDDGYVLDGTTFGSLPAVAEQIVAQLRASRALINPLRNRPSETAGVIPGTSLVSGGVGQEGRLPTPGIPARFRVPASETGNSGLCGGGGSFRRTGLGTDSVETGNLQGILRNSVAVALILASIPFLFQ